MISLAHDQSDTITNQQDGTTETFLFFYFFITKDES